MGWKVVLVVAMAIAAPAARADRELTGGINLRSDLGTQFVRADGGIVVDRLSVVLVVDPYGYWTGQQHDTELLAGWELWRGGWSAVGGWRVSSLPLLGTRYYQQKLIAGVAAPLTKLPIPHLRARIGAEWAVTLVRHGDDLPTRWIWEEDELRGGSFNLGLFLRVEAGGPF